MTTRRALDNSEALKSFTNMKANIDGMLARIATLSDDHFNVAPEEVHWGHAGDLVRIASLLRQITDAAFKEGEHAE